MNIHEEQIARYSQIGFRRLLSITYKLKGREGLSNLLGVINPEIKTLLTAREISKDELESLTLFLEETKSFVRGLRKT